MFKRKKLFIVAVLVGLVFPVASHAGSSSGPVTQLIVNSVSKVFFKAGTNAAPPACATAVDSWALDASTPEGKAMYAVLLTAKALEKNVTVQGLNNCAVHPDREKVQFIIAAD